MNQSSKIYVAGHCGLVGSAIWSNLQQKGYTHLIGRTHDELDLLDSTAVRRFFDDERPEYVFLAAAYVGGIVANNRYRADFIYRNLGIQQHVIGESYRHGVKKLLFLGSTCIYPRDVSQPMKEQALLTASLEYTNEPYAIAKIAGLKMCESFNLQYGTNYIAVMPTNLYGPNDNFDLERSHVLPAMVRKIHLAKCLEESDMDAVRADLAKRPVEGEDGTGSDKDILDLLARYGITPSGVTLWGTGRPLREFLWSEEMADACVYIMEHVDFDDLRDETNEVRNCHINIGTGKEIAIRELAQLVARTAGYRGTLAFDASKPDGTMRKLTDVSKLHALGWHHRVEIDEGVERMYRWYLQ
ncbi:GDP-L-fucose synthetase [Tannerella forsythia KS16]|jgi:Nucleoside-diphosphate-sugar epimerases|uniref:GDP-L-fucose synthase n=2 Tax=Tannerella forsythia TaxID=28112 RepID=G8UQC2_TANFA|nr:GDP-L-fucose synthase [Tannerella forsythia]AEW22593.1 GDP-L-fucose synthetase [Tannerella forsythia 92A2]OLQ19954.1 GDP-fucose synthetase [Tannerella forsythia]PDP44772.1 GDP-L-fucose synthase [Tannerella forsythia]PDP70946.1 GDP-L-fucose synthase [Tannerella forsythia]SCQ23533.1 GDP-L-fucose synthase [Tannerella forsythia]